MMCGTFYNKADQLLQKQCSDFPNFTDPTPSASGLGFNKINPNPKRKKSNLFLEVSLMEFLLVRNTSEMVLSIENILFIQQNPNIENLKEIMEAWIGEKISQESYLNFRITSECNIVFKDLHSEKFYHILNDINPIDRSNLKVLISLIKKKQLNGSINTYSEYCAECPNTLTYKAFLERYNTLNNTIGSCDSL